MTKRFFQILLIFISLNAVTASAQYLSPIWATRVTAYPDTYHYGAIQADSNGNVYVISFVITGSSLYSYPLILQKYNGNGNLLWQDTITQTNGVAKIAILPSGLIVVACAKSFPSIWGYVNTLAAFSPSGTLQWINHYDSSPLHNSDDLVAMTTDTTGAIYVMSSSFSTVTYLRQGFIFKSDSMGNLIWSDSIAIANKNIYAQDISVDSHGQLYAALQEEDPTVQTYGLFIKYFSSGQREYQNLYLLGNGDFFKFIRVYNDTAIYVGSITGSFSNNFLTVIKYDSSASFRFSSNFFPQTYFNWTGIDTANQITAMAINTNGDIFLGTSLFNGTTGLRATVVQFTAQGNSGWVATPYTMGDVSAMEFDASGNLFVGGWYRDTLTGITPIFLSKIDMNGTILWRGQFGDAIFNPPGISLDPNENIFMASDQSGIYPDSLYTIKIGSTTGIEETDFANTILVYPNPASRSVTFQMACINPSEIVITDQLGREIMRQEINGEKQIEISVADLANGMYFYQYIEKGERKASGKFIVQH